MGPVQDPRAGRLLNEYRERFGGADLPVPVDAIAEDLLGLRVSESAQLDYSGVLIPARREILINAVEAAESPGRRRFTLAHELGHWVCQVLEGHAAPVYCRDADLDEVVDRSLEREANVFAAELLMPEPLVRTEAAERHLEEMADRFGVSGLAMGWRLYNLGLVEYQPVATRDPASARDAQAGRDDYPG